MNNGFLPEILAAEREIRLQIESMEQETTDHLGKLKQELDLVLAAESELLQTELHSAMARAEHSAQVEAEALLAKARAYALRQNNLDLVELDRVILRHLAQINPEGAHDCQNEQT